MLSSIRSFLRSLVAKSETGLLPPPLFSTISLTFSLLVLLPSIYLPPLHPIFNSVFRLFLYLPHVPVPLPLSFLSLFPSSFLLSRSLTSPVSLLRLLLHFHLFRHSVNHLSYMSPHLLQTVSCPSLCSLLHYSVGHLSLLVFRLPV